MFCVVQFEYTSRNAAGDSMYGKLPSPVAVLTLDQDRKTGQLKLVKYHNVDTGGVNGLWITCGASLSPWGTHLSSEEYEPMPPLLRPIRSSSPTAETSTPMRRPLPIPTTMATCPK